MELFRRLCLVTALLSAGVSDSFIMASSSSSSSISGPGAAAAATEGGDDTREIPLLPEADPNSNIPRLKLGETIRFEAMGPIILNLDGTTRRIDNWDQLTEREKEVTWRRIGKRNEERRKMLLERQQQQEQVGQEVSSEKDEL